MANPRETKRENFDVSPQQQADIEMLRELIDASSKKDAMLFAVRLALHLAAELKGGNQVFIGDESKQDLRRLLVLEMEKPKISRWKYLVERPHQWKKQLFVKGRKLPAANVVWTMRANNMTVEEAADDWDLPEDVVRECIDYCEADKVLIQMESQEELLCLNEAQARGRVSKAPPR